VPSGRHHKPPLSPLSGAGTLHASWSYFRPPGLSTTLILRLNLECPALIASQVMSIRVLCTKSFLGISRQGSNDPNGFGYYGGSAFLLFGQIAII